MTNATIILPWAVFAAGCAWLMWKAKKAKEDYLLNRAEQERLEAIRAKLNQAVFERAMRTERYGTIVR